ncbi:MAG: hypothetical protein K2X48_00840, partial [Chitinophagaceae bacterium]|nr:hypothetical protein [Chitinophagaceae bacterium]
MIGFKYYRQRRCSLIKFILPSFLLHLFYFAQHIIIHLGFMGCQFYLTVGVLTNRNQNHQLKISFNLMLA